MTVTAKPLVTASYASDTEATVYTTPAGVRTIVDKFTGYNSTAGAVSLTVKIVANAGTAGASNVLAVKSLAAGETYNFPEIVGHVMESGGFVSVLAGSASAIVIRASGREVS